MSDGSHIGQIVGHRLYRTTHTHHSHSLQKRTSQLKYLIIHNTKETVPCGTRVTLTFTFGIVVVAWRTSVTHTAGKVIFTYTLTAVVTGILLVTRVLTATFYSVQIGHKCELNIEFVLAL